MHQCSYSAFREAVLHWFMGSREISLLQRRMKSIMVSYSYRKGISFDQIFCCFFFQLVEWYITKIQFTST